MNICIFIMLAISIQTIFLLNSHNFVKTDFLVWYVEEFTFLINITKRKDSERSKWEALKRKCSLMQHLKKRYYKIDQHLARHFKYNGTCLSMLSNITPFLIQWSPPIRKQGYDFSQLWNPYTLILFLF